MADQNKATESNKSPRQEAAAEAKPAEKSAAAETKPAEKDQKASEDANKKAAEALSPAPVTRVKEGVTIEFSRPDSKTCPGYYIMPAEHAGGREINKTPSIIVLSKWWGVNDQIKGFGRRFAEAGFRVLIPDFYRGKVASNKDEASHLFKNLDWKEATLDMRGAAAFLAQGHPAVAAIGFCMGGALALVAAQHCRLAAAVSFYGYPPDDACNPSEIKCPVHFHWAKKDDWCNAEAASKITSKLLSGNVRYEFYWYDAQHAFANEGRPEVYDPVATRQALDRTLVFFGSKLYH